MEYDIKTQMLKCPNCGNTIELVNDKSSIVEHSLTMDARRTLKPAEKKSSTMECSGCGATVEIAANDTTSECPYCGAKYVLAQKQQDAIIPDGIVPFAIDRNRANEVFGTWINKRWLAPGKLKSLYQQEKIISLYLPLWTFDAQADATYTARGGRNHYETHKDKDGREYTEKITDWYPTAGKVSNFFDDVTIKAVNNERARFLEKLEPYDLSRIVSYSPEYLQGCLSQCYEVDLESAHQSAVKKMEAELTDKAKKDVLKKYDEADSVKIRARYRDETYKHILVPVYSTGYNYKGRNYSVSINGQSGKINGDYPLSPIKICVIIAVIIAIIIAFFSFSGSEKESYSTSTQISQPAVTYSMETDNSNITVDGLEDILWDL
jgi:DNA-directed RNA polymerase subunit RPC12/RpoP